MKSKIGKPVCPAVDVQVRKDNRVEGSRVNWPVHYRLEPVKVQYKTNVNVMEIQH